MTQLLVVGERRGEEGPSGGDGGSDGSLCS